MNGREIHVFKEAQVTDLRQRGEVFIEERNNTWNTPFLFNAKELDEETGLYYYNARYYDPRTSLFLSTDPMQEMYPGISTYAYCNNNPIKYIDPTGMNWYAKDGDMEKGDVKWFDNKNGEGNRPQDYSFDEDGSMYKFYSAGAKEGGEVVGSSNSNKSLIGRLWDRFKTWGDKNRDLRYQEPGYGNSWTGRSAMEHGKATQKYGEGQDGTPGISGKRGSIIRKLGKENILASIFEKLLPNNYNSSEQAPQTHQVPYALPNQTPQISSPKPNEPKVVPDSIKPKPSGSTFKSDSTTIQRRDSADILRIYRAADSIHGYGPFVP